MRPGFTFCLTLLGVLLAGVPLLYLTQEAPRRQAMPHPMQETPTTDKTFVRVQFTGTPTSCILRFEGQDLASMPAGTTSPWETELNLPSTQHSELEAEIQWPENSPENAVSITLEPAQKEARTCTHWTGVDGTLLHDLFIFTW